MINYGSNSNLPQPSYRVARSLALIFSPALKFHRSLFSSRLSMTWNIWTYLDFHLKRILPKVYLSLGRFYINDQNARILLEHGGPKLHRLKKDSQGQIYIFNNVATKHRYIAESIPYAHHLVNFSLRHIFNLIIFQCIFNFVAFRLVSLESWIKTDIRRITMILSIPLPVLGIAIHWSW